MTCLFSVGLQLLRKRHIGNDIVTIVFQEPGALPFSPRTVRSQFQHVFVIVQVTNPNSENTRYRSVVRAAWRVVWGMGDNCSASDNLTVLADLADRKVTHDKGKETKRTCTKLP